VPDLVLGLDAILGAANTENADRTRQSQSVTLIEANPELADDDLVDNVASNYRVTRREATFAVGEVVIVLDSQLVVSIQAGAALTAGDREYTSDETYTARLTSAQVVADTDRLLVELAPGQWGFSINVTAAEAGSASLLRKDTELIPTFPPTNFLRAYAAADFTGGLDAQTNQELVDLFQDSMATKAYSNRSMNRNMIRNADPDVYEMVTDDFDDILDISIIGFGDAEMVRDQHWVWPTSGGGRSDLYCRNQRLPAILGLTKTATLIEQVAEGGVWQLAILRDDAPGFYETRSIRAPGTGPTGTNYAVQEDIRGLDTTQTNGDYIPDVLTALEGGYSRYQTAVIQFLDTDTLPSASVGATQDYDVTVAAMPLIKEVQEFIGLRDVRNPCGDHLIKAPVPCFMSLTVVLERTNTTDEIDETAVADAAADYVNTTGFPGKIFSTDLANAIASLLPASTSTDTITMFGRVRSPDGSETILNSLEVITAPDDPATFTTGRTVGFILDPEDVAITINDVAAPET
jgi:hypothetical protein